MQAEKDRITLIKFSSCEYINELQKGKVYMNTLGYFINCESQFHQDDLEGIDIFHQAENITIKIESPHIKPIILTKEAGLINFRAGRTSTHLFNIYCMYLWKFNEHNFSKIDFRVLQLGEAALIITDVDEFMRRVTKAIKRDDLIHNVKAKVVEYFDEDTYHGDVGIFKKRKSLEYMKEYRIAIRARMDDKPYVLEIGDISDITVIVNSLEINSLHINYSDKQIA